jgi:DNA-binding NarL/FixJ family response regulator
MTTPESPASSSSSSQTQQPEAPNYKGTLNLPKTSGREVLEQIKQDDSLRSIPIIVLTSSSADTDIIESYGLYASCYVVKPLNAEKFISIIKEVDDFWVDIVCVNSGQ